MAGVVGPVSSTHLDVYKRQGFTDEAGVVLLPAAEDLQRPVDLPVTAHDMVDAAFLGLLGQVFAVGLLSLIHI